MLAQSIPDAPFVPTPKTERHRVAAHIQRAERAAARSQARLDPLTRLVRHLLLGELTRYRKQGVFPKNPGIEQTPIFVDGRGVRCAMAHLLEVGGEGALVGKIARERNLAYVRELTDEPRLMAWLAAAGITAAEAAAIQPSYCDTNSACVCGDGGFSYVAYPVPALGVLEGTVTTNGSGGTAMVTIATIHGEGGTYTVGDSVAANVGSAAAGARVLVPVGAPSGDGGSALAGVVIDGDGTYTCRSQSVGARPVSAELFIAAVTSSDCAGTLAAADSSWADNSCDGPSGSGGCAVGGDAPSTLGILLAVVSVIAARRLAGSSGR